MMPQRSQNSSMAVTDKPHEPCFGGLLVAWAKQLCKAANIDPPLLLRDNCWKRNRFTKKSPGRSIRDRHPKQSRMSSASGARIYKSIDGPAHVGTPHSISRPRTPTGSSTGLVPHSRLRRPPGPVRLPQSCQPVRASAPQNRRPRANSSRSRYCQAPWHPPR